MEDELWHSIRVRILYIMDFALLAEWSKTN